MIIARSGRLTALFTLSARAQHRSMQPFLFSISTELISEIISVVHYFYAPDDSVF